MARFKQKQTGSVINVPDEKVAQVLAQGLYEQVDAKKQPAKKSAAAKK